jgi:hypothetical protein
MMAKQESPFPNVTVATVKAVRRDVKLLMFRLDCGFVLARLNLFAECVDPIRVFSQDFWRRPATGEAEVVPWFSVAGANFRVVKPNYRGSPEAPFPAPFRHSLVTCNRLDSLGFSSLCGMLE